MRARAFGAWAMREELRGLELEVETHQALEQTSRLYHFGVGLYNWIQRHHPNLHHVYFNVLEVMGPCRSKRYLRNAPLFRGLLETVEPEVVVSVHPSLNHAFFEVAQETLGAGRVRCVTYCGELHGGYGFSRHWVNPEANLFVGAVEETCEAARALGMPTGRTWTGGFMLDPSFYAPPMGEREKAAFVRDLGLEPEEPVLMLSTGGRGANNHAAFLRVLEGLPRPPQVLAVCGRSSRTRVEVKRWAGRSRTLRVRALGLRTDMARLMSVSWAVVARGGTGTTSETIMAGVPLIVNGLGGVMPQERITVRYCARHGFGPVVRSPGDLRKVVRRWQESPAVYEAVRAGVAAARPKHDPVELWRKVAGVE